MFRKENSKKVISIFTMILALALITFSFVGCGSKSVNSYLFIIIFIVIGGVIGLVFVVSFFIKLTAKTWKYTFNKAKDNRGKINVGPSNTVDPNNLGVVSGNCFSSNAVLSLVMVNPNGLEDPSDKLKVTSGGREFLFGHKDIENACVCCCSPMNYGLSIELIIKYRVQLTDGKDFIITTKQQISSEVVERILF